jgi:hypothetical protein
MRKVTKEAVSAFNQKRNKSIGNTSVIVNESVGIVGLYLHGNLIAERHIETDAIRITNAGWFSPTTKERLNGLPGVSVAQKDGNWYLNGELWNGEWKQIQ